MSGRYSKLFTLPKNLYIDGSPVVISAGALQKDNDKDSVLAQLKFRSICNKEIKAVTVKIFPKDTAGRELGESVEHKYLDLSAKRNDEFAQKEPVYLPDNSTRAFSVLVSEVIFSDNSIWSCDDADWASLPDKNTQFGDTELIKQYKIKYGPKACKELVCMNSIWICTCGNVNNADESRCFSCGVEIEKLKAFDIEQLKAECSARLEKEEQARQEARKKEAEEQARLEAERAERERERQKLEAERKEAEKKRNKIIGIAAGIVAVCIVCAAVTKNVIIPAVNYNKAVSLIEEESYDEAIALLDKLDTYKDSKELVDITLVNKNNYAKYQQGLSELESGSFDEAIDTFKALGSFKDSANQLGQYRTNP